MIILLILPDLFKINLFQEILIQEKAKIRLEIIKDQIVHLRENQVMNVKLSSVVNVLVHRNKKNCLFKDLYD